MRKQIVIALAITSSFALTACGNDHKGSAKASVAAAKTKVQAAKATGDQKEQKENFDEIMGKIEAKRVELRKKQFYAADEQTSEMGVVVGAADNVLGTKQDKREFAVQTLKEMKGFSEALVSSAKDLKDNAKVAQAEETKAIIESALEKAQNRNGFKPFSADLYLRMFGTVVSGVKAAPEAVPAFLWSLPNESKIAAEKFGTAVYAGAAHGYAVADKKINGEQPAPTGKYAEVKSKIDEQVKALNELGYHDQDEQYSVAQLMSDAKGLVKSHSADELAKIKSILTSVKADLDQLVITANENNDDFQKKQSVYLFNLAKANIASVEKAEKKAQKAAIKAEKRKQNVEQSTTMQIDPMGNPF